MVSTAETRDHTLVPTASVADMQAMVGDVIQGANQHLPSHSSSKATYHRTNRTSIAWLDSVVPILALQVTGWTLDCGVLVKS